MTSASEHTSVPMSSPPFSTGSRLPPIAEEVLPPVFEDHKPSDINEIRQLTRRLRTTKRRLLLAYAGEKPADEELPSSDQEADRASAAGAVHQLRGLLLQLALEQLTKTASRAPLYPLDPNAPISDKLSLRQQVNTASVASTTMPNVQQHQHGKRRDLSSSVGKAQQSCPPEEMSSASSQKNTTSSLDSRRPIAKHIQMPSAA